MFIRPLVITPRGDKQRTYTYIKISYIPNSYPRNRLVKVPEAPEVT